MLEDNPVIKQGLFPLPGGNTLVLQGGSKLKTEYQYELAKALFEDHETYKDLFAQVKTSVEKGGWALKIKISSNGECLCVKVGVEGA